MANSKSRRFDPRFYSEFRHEGTPEATIADFCNAARQLLTRFISDLRSTNTGRFGLDSNEEYEQMAIGVERIMGHVDMFEKLASGQGVPPEEARIVKNLVANVLADANATEIAKARAQAPKANEAKFDQGKTGSSVEGMKEYSDKIKDAGEGIAKILGNNIMEGLFDILAAILEDIAIFGEKAAADTGGNEATRQIEDKLNYVMPIAEALKAAQDSAGDVLSRIDEKTSHIKGEVDNLEYKAERLGALLGRTLVGSEWIVRPTTAARNNVVPPISIKDEMHGIENLLLLIIKVIINIFPPRVYKLISSSVTGLTPPPAGSKPLIDEQLKKIFVYAEDKFAPQSASQRRTIDIQTPAFDLSGWIDLSDLRSGDAVEIALFVSLAGRRRRFHRQRFDQAAILPFADFARGLQYICGNDVRIQIRQPVSADNFANPVQIGYQFVVESQ